MDGQRTTSDCASMRFKGKYRARFEYEQMLRRETWEQTKNTIGRGVLYAATGYWARRRWWSSLWVLERHFVQKAVSPWTIMPPSTADGACSVGVEHLVSLDMTNLGKKSLIQSARSVNCNQTSKGITVHPCTIKRLLVRSPRSSSIISRACETQLLD